MQRWSDLVDRKRKNHKQRWERINQVPHESWKQNPKDAEVPIQQARHESAEYAYGPAGDAKTAGSLLSLFLLFFTLGFVDYLAKETNRYGNEQDCVREGRNWRRPRPKDKKGSSRKRYKDASRKWINVDSWYIFAWLALVIRFGATRRRGPETAWSTKYNLGDRTARDAMNRNAFSQLSRFLHFSNSCAIPTSSAAAVETSCTRCVTSSTFCRGSSKSCGQWGLT